MVRTGKKDTEAPECPQPSRPLEKCIAIRIEQHSRETDQCNDEFYAEENKGGNCGERGGTPDKD